MTFRAPDDGLDPRDQLVLLEGLGQIVIGTGPEPLDLTLRFGEAREDQHGRFDTRVAHAPQHLHPVDVGQLEIENDDVVIVELGDLKTVFAQVRRIDHHGRRFEQHFDAFCRGRLILDQ